jgi:O-acetyl-ADP-ribose deacetylase (regulator of RNase III)
VAGPELLEECKTLGGCKTGEAKITGGYNLPAKWVIHTVGPIWQGGTENEEVLLANCYRNSLALAVENGVKTMAFPSISTGAYRFPIDLASKIAIGEISQFLEETESVEKVFMVCFDSRTHIAYSNALKEMD